MAPWLCLLACTIVLLHLALLGMCAIARSKTAGRLRRQSTTRAVEQLALRRLEDHTYRTMQRLLDEARRQS